MDNLGTVVDVIYIGTERVEGRNLVKIPGWHESYLNSAIHTFSTGAVHDWISFFREGWASALYHDKFYELALNLRRALALDKGALAVVEAVCEVAENSSDDQLVAGKRKEIIGSRGELLQDTTKQVIDSAALDFLRRQKNMLSRFHVPNPAGSGALNRALSTKGI